MHVRSKQDNIEMRNLFTNHIAICSEFFFCGKSRNRFASGDDFLPFKFEFSMFYLFCRLHLDAVVELRTIYRYLVAERKSFFAKKTRPTHNRIENKRNVTSYAWCIETRTETDTLFCLWFFCEYKIISNMIFSSCFRFELHSCFFCQVLWFPHNEKKK